MGLRRAEVSPSSLEDPVESQILGGLCPICVLDLDCLLGILDSWWLSHSKARPSLAGWLPRSGMSERRRGSGFVLVLRGAWTPVVLASSP